ncbi:MAG: carboxypeptidase regulatory-like domain-containing protein, partial [Candidatus Paceibacterota bacterium]
ATPAGGKHSFLLAPQTYRVEVSKSNYSNARTYGTGEIAVPDNPDPTVLEGQEVPVGLSIALAGTISVDGISPTGQGDFADSFDSSPQVSASENVQFLDGDILLSGPSYSATGWAISDAIAPVDLVAWNELRFDDARPALTNSFYQLLYYDGANWVLVPDSDLGGNSTGLNVSPINLAGLDAGIYPQIKIKGNLSTGDPNSSPRIHNWQVVWTTDSGAAVPGASFHIQGTKTVGEDAMGQKVRKWSQDLNLDGNGNLVIMEVDADAYDFSVDPAGGLSLIGTDPALLPINVVSENTTAVKLFLRAQNALLATIQDDVTLGPVFSAAVKLANSGIGYEKTQHTDENGQTYFAPLANGTYDITVSAAGFAGYSGTVSISGQSAKIINIHQNE